MYFLHFKPQTFYFSLKLLEVENSDDAFQKAGHLRRSKKYNSHSRRTSNGGNLHGSYVTPYVWIFPMLYDKKFILTRNARASNTKFCMYVIFHELLKKMDRIFQYGRKIQDGG